MADGITIIKKFPSKGRGLIAPLFVSGLLLLFAVVDCFGAEPAHLANQDASQLRKLTAPFTFVVFGDNRTGNEVYGGLAKRIVEEKPAFVINVGDVTADEGDVKLWNEFVRLSAPITVPYFIVPGNHEINDKGSEAEFKQFVQQPGNELYYSFKVGGALCIILDTEQPGFVSRIAGDQQVWLKGVLAGSKEKYKFVFLHRPMYPYKGVGHHYGDSLNKFEADRDRLQSLFVKYKVDAVFAGHEHFYKRGEKDGIVEVITGGGGSPLYTHESEGGFYHYIRADISKNSAVFKVIDDKGMVRDTFKISKGD